MKIRRFLLVMTALLFALALPLQAQAAATSVSLLRVTWDHDPVTVYISLQKGVDASYGSMVEAAFNDWGSALKTASGNADAFDFTFLTDKPSKKNPPDVSVTVRKNTGMILGSASVSSRGGVISNVKVTLTAYNAIGLPLGESDFRSIARHEIGHALGLGHSNDDGAEPLDLMAPSFDFVGVNYDIYPSALNIDALLYIYGSDGFGGANTSPIPASYP